MRRGSPRSSPSSSSSPHDAGQGDFELTPMLDLAFIVLIFLLVAAALGRQAGIAVDRPAALTAEPVPHAAIRVAVTAGDEIWIAERPVDARVVQLELERVHAEYPRGALVVHADRKSSARAVAAVLDAARAAGIEDVAIATQGE